MSFQESKTTPLSAAGGQKAIPLDGRQFPTADKRVVMCWVVLVIFLLSFALFFVVVSHALDSIIQISASVSSPSSAPGTLVRMP